MRMVFNNIQSPCYMCEQRKAGCHNQCADYKNYRIEIEKLKLEKEQRYKEWADVKGAMNSMTKARVYGGV